MERVLITGPLSAARVAAAAPSCKTPHPLQACHQQPTPPGAWPVPGCRRLLGSGGELRSVQTSCGDLPPQGTASRWSGTWFWSVGVRSGCSGTICVPSKSTQGQATVFIGHFDGRIRPMGPLRPSYKHDRTGLRKKNQDAENGRVEGEKVLGP